MTHASTSPKVGDSVRLNPNHPYLAAFLRQIQGLGHGATALFNDLFEITEIDENNVVHLRTGDPDDFTVDVTIPLAGFDEHRAKPN